MHYYCYYDFYICYDFDDDHDEDCDEDDDDHHHGHAPCVFRSPRLCADCKCYGGEGCERFDCLGVLLKCTCEFIRASNFMRCEQLCFDILAGNQADMRAEAGKDERLQRQWPDPIGGH